MTNSFFTFWHVWFFQKYSYASIVTYVTCGMLQTIYAAKIRFRFCTVSKLQCFTPPMALWRLPRHVCQMLNPCRPCSIFFNTGVSGEPVPTGYPSCGRRVGSQRLQQVPPDEAWSPRSLCLSRSGSGRGRRGHADPRAWRSIPTVWLEVQTSKQGWYQFKLSHFSFLTPREYRNNKCWSTFNVSLKPNRTSSQHRT